MLTINPSKDFSFTVFQGAIVTISGANGSGKTSLLRSISSSINDPRYKKLYIGHNNAVKLALTVYENLKLWCSIYNSEKALPSALFYLNLENIANTRCSLLSAGTIQRVAIARLLICPADIWFLDEIDSNLDTFYLERLKNIIQSKSSNKGIIFCTSHNESIFSISNIKLSAEDICDL